MMPKGELIGISPETLDISDSNLPALVNTQGFVKPNTTDYDIHVIHSGVCLANVFNEMRIAFSEFARCFCKYIYAVRRAITDAYFVHVAPNSRIKYLAMYAKKRRVRKKNIARLAKKMSKHIKGKMQSCEFVLSETEAPEDVWVRQNTQGDCENDSNNN